MTKFCYILYSLCFIKFYVELTVNMLQMKTIQKFLMPACLGLTQICAVKITSLPLTTTNTI